MGPLSYLTMFGWIPFVLYLFKWLPSVRAVTLAFVAGFLFLPQAVFPIGGLPSYTRMSATAIAALLGTILFDAKHLRSFRLSWLDIPMIVWCLCPFASSITNGLGWYDGFRQSSDQTVAWGAAYFLGKLYLSHLDALRKLAVSIFAGALLYIPFCLYEFKTGPSLHQIVYGFSVANYIGAVRSVGFRPTVFLASGLMTGVWLMSSIIIGVWLWKAGVLKRLWGIQMKWLLPAVTFTLVLSQSMSALISTIVGLALLFLMRWLRTPLLILILITALPTYVYFQATGNFNTEQALSIAEQTLGPDRASSLGTRLNSEKVLLVKARQRMMFGWGGWGRSRVTSEWGEDNVVTDSQWVIAFGSCGLVGLISFTVAILLPTVAFIFAFPVTRWHEKKVAGAAALAVILPFYMLDCILNAMPNAVIIFASGGISGLAINQFRNTQQTGVNLLVAEKYLIQQDLRAFSQQVPSDTPKDPVP